MSKSKLLVSLALFVVVAIANVRAYGPQGKTTLHEASAAATVDNPASAETGVVAVRSEAGMRVPRFENVATDATPENRWLHEMMSKPVPPLDFPGNTPLSEILDTIASHYSSKFGAGGGPDGGDFRMTFYPDSAELNLEDISSLEDVLVSDIKFEGMRLDNALTLIFEQTFAPKLTYLIENQVMKVTTLAKAESDNSLVTRVYNVGELADLKFRAGQLSRPRIRKPSNDIPPKGGGVDCFSVPDQSSTGKTASASQAHREAAVLPSDLKSLILEMTTPSAKWFTIDGEGGAIRLVGHLLFVRHTRAVQDQIVHLLNLLDRDSTYETRVYKVGHLDDLPFPPDRVSGTRIFKSTPADSSDIAPVESKRNSVANANLESLIVEMTGRHWTTTDGEGGAIRRIGQNLVIRQTDAVHSQIVALLELLNGINEPDE